MPGWTHYRASFGHRRGHILCQYAYRKFSLYFVLVRAVEKGNFDHETVFMMKSATTLHTLNYLFSYYFLVH